MRADLVALALASVAMAVGALPSRARAAEVVTPSAGASGPAIDLARHRVQSIEIPVPTNARQATDQLQDVHLFRNELRIDGIAQPIPLARSLIGLLQPDLEEWRLGFDPQTLKLEWLVPDELLWITWGTPFLGRGGFRKQGAVLLERAGDVWRELFRDSIFASAAMGTGNWMHAELGASWDAAARLVTLTESEESSDTSREPDPLYDEPAAADARDQDYVHRRKSRDVRRYAIRNGVLEPVGGERWIELEEPRPAQKVAEVYGVSLDELARLNPDLGRDGDASGAVRIADRIDPYRFQQDDGICESPCPQPSGAVAVLPPIDLAKHRIQSTDVTEPTGTAAAATRGSDVRLMRYDLIVDGIAPPIRLGRSKVRLLESGTTLEAGFDPRTLELEWLVPNELLWITWSTVPQGSGGSRKQGAVLLERSADTWRELFRDSIDAHGSTGSGSWTQTELVASWAPAGRILTLMVRSESSETASEPGPFSGKPATTDAGSRVYVTSMKTVEVRHYAIRDGGLEQMSGERSVQLGEPRPAEKVAQAFGIPFDELVRLNGYLTHDHVMRVVRLVDRVDPYRFQNDDGICEKPCPEPRSTPLAPGGAP